MSYSNLWVIDKNFNGEGKDEFPNSWSLSPVVWDILLEKYLPDQDSKTRGYKRHYIPASMMDNTLFSRLNNLINGSEDQVDRVLWEFTNQQVFDIKDKEFVSDCVKYFLERNKVLSFDVIDKVQYRFNEVAKSILFLDREEYIYFIWKGSSCDDSVESWFKSYDEESEENKSKPLNMSTDLLCEFVVIKDNRVVDFVSNLDFFKDK